MSLFYLKKQDSNSDIVNKIGITHLVDITQT